MKTVIAVLLQMFNLLIRQLSRFQRTQILVDSGQGVYIAPSTRRLLRREGYRVLIELSLRDMGL